MPLRAVYANSSASVFHFIDSSTTMAVNNDKICDGLFSSEEEELQGHAEATKYMLAFVESMAVKCVVLLGIPDMIAKEGPCATLSLNEIVSRLPTESPDASCLFRIMRFLVAKGVFSTSVVDCDTRYGLMPSSKWLVNERNLSIVPLHLVLNAEIAMAAWHRLNQCVLHRGIAFKRANGCDLWSYGSANPDFNNLFNDAMANNSRTVMKALLSNYQGFQAITSLVDVGGGTGTAMAEIVKAYPSIKGISYDLPHVVATAPHLPGTDFSSN